MNSARPPARPIFRRLAIGIGVICVVISLAFLAVGDSNTRLMGLSVSGFVALVMFTIGFMGRWPSPREPSR